MEDARILGELTQRTQRAVAHYWQTRSALRRRQEESGKADQGLRSAVTCDEFDRWFQQIWSIPGASTKQHPAPFPFELAVRLVRMFSFTEDTVLDPFCGTGTTMIAALRTGRNNIGVEIEPEYCRMAARYFKAENPDLFSNAKLIFEKATTERACLVREDHELYEVRPARKKLD
jgi:hypothetical protein